MYSTANLFQKKWFIYLASGLVKTKLLSKNFFTNSIGVVDLVTQDKERNSRQLFYGKESLGKTVENISREHL
jgi:hypothetical protein